MKGFGSTHCSENSSEIKSTILQYKNKSKVPEFEKTALKTFIWQPDIKGPRIGKIL